MKEYKIEIKEYRKRFYVFAGKSRLSIGYKLKEEAEKELKENSKLYKYWSGSISVSVENSEHKIIEVKR